MRKLATIRVIEDLKPIDGADRIELAIIDGWQVIVKKGEFNIGSRCVYFEIDSLLPEKPEFEFLRKSSYVSEKNSVNGAGFRLKTIRLRGYISQGLALPLETFGQDFLEKHIVSQIGKDVTDELGIKKYEKPVPPQLSGFVKGNFPSFLKKTDVERIQNYYKHLKNSDAYKDFWEGTYKMDGSSMTVYWKDGNFGVCSRNIDLEENDDNTFWKVAKKLNLREILSDIGMNVALQGELMGPGIQKNRWKLKEHDFFLFDVWLIDEQRYMTSDERLEFLKNKLKNTIKHVPIYGITILGDHEMNCFSLNFLLKLSDDLYNGGFHYGLVPNDINTIDIDSTIQFEGIVWKNVNDPFKRFKVISNRYLLNNGE